MESNDPKHILVIDDDRRIRELIRSYLVENGFMVSVAGSAAEAREKMRGIMFDLLVLDVMMPGETGITFIEALRKSGHVVPVLMLSALAEADDRIAGLSHGSDDYLVKPFEPRELLLRIGNLMRRVSVQAAPSAVICFGEFQFVPGKGDLRRAGELIRLTSGERELLRQLSARPGQPLSRQELLPAGAEDASRSLDVQINRLRQKIEADPANPKYVVTVRGAGYALMTDGP